jgi:hypothetical protein
MSKDVNKKIKGLRSVTKAKLSIIKKHTKLIEVAFNELNQIREVDPQIIQERIKAIDDKFTKHGFKSD